ncbi:glycosyltransferase family 4 protein [Blastococcus sp. TML/C7B]|uniref:glycosyltransferase family 4 protein n=1 Tax=Blastococcus sp. TML/C7B TaxID=2798728 RepID=UPI00190B7B39|nr:glycosyltransferase family 4 protein [Blastococcus sp. TML/C7B]MBN1097604.1 glycosyltransferase family 4 protein [Blastococcus sp. TML/C7B]
MLRASEDTDVLFVNWRDLSHPEGGGSERYVHRIAEGLAAAGLRVSLLCAAHGRAPAEEVVNGVRIVRRGGRLTVYPRALSHVLRHRPRLVVDVQNGIPFGSTLVTRAPVTVLVHHVHREQWPIVFGRVGGRLGWWIESVLAPRLYRRARYVTVSEATRTELVELGIDAARIDIVPVGVEPTPAVRSARSPAPELLVVARLVPHKRVEHALAVLARLADRWPDLTLTVVGEGWCEPELRAEAERLGVTDRVTFAGFVDEQTKHERLASAWVHLVPSVKEGWCLVVNEAGGHRVPTVGYRSAGGLRESVVDGVSGVLVDDLEEMVTATAQLLEDRSTREAMGAAAARHAASLAWGASARAFAAVLAASARSASAAGARTALGPLAAALDRIATGDAAGPASVTGRVRLARLARGPRALEELAARRTD